MDILSEILASVRSTAPLIADLRMVGQWGIDIETNAVGTPFHYVAAGSCWLIHGDEKRKLRHGDLVIASSWPRHILASRRQPNVLQSIRDLVADHGYEIWTPEHGTRGPLSIGPRDSYDVEILSGIFGFDSTNAAFLMEALPPIMVLEAREHDLVPLLDNMLALIRKEGDRLSPGFEAVAGRGMEFVFIHALRTWAFLSSDRAGWLNGVLDPQIGRALRAMHAEPARHWNLSSLAVIAGLSRAVFASTFRTMMSETPFGYLTRWRLGRAAARLMESGTGVSRIAEEVGYGSASALTRAFRRQYGCTPAEFRQRREAAK